MDDTLYDRDFYLWTVEQARILRDASRLGSNIPADWANVAEEIEDLGKSNKTEIKSRLNQIVIHLLKLALSPADPPRAGWRTEIQNHRFEIALKLEESPSLRGGLDDALEAIWPKAVKRAVADLEDHDERPKDPSSRGVAAMVRPSLAQVLDDEFFPERGSLSLSEAASA